MEAGEEPAREAISHARDPRCPVPGSQPGGLLNRGRSPARPGPVGCTDASQVAEAYDLDAAPASDIDPRAIASRDPGLGLGVGNVAKEGLGSTQPVGQGG